MLTAMLSGTATVLPSGRILKLVWGAGTDANALPAGATSIAYCEPIPVSDVEQLGVLLFPNSGISVGVVARIQWSPDGVNFVEEKLEQPGAVSGGVQQFQSVIKEWGPNTAPWPIWRPVTCPYFRLGVYAVSATASTDSVAAFVMLQRPGQLQGPAA